MFTVALQPQSVHDILAEPLRDQPLGNTGITLLVLLVAVAIVLFQALRAVLRALIGLLLPTLVLLRSFVLVVGLIAVIGFGLVTGSPEPAPDESQRTPATPSSSTARSNPRTPAVPPLKKLAPATPHR